MNIDAAWNVDTARLYQPILNDLFPLNAVAKPGMIYDELKLQNKCITAHVIHHLADVVKDAWRIVVMIACWCCDSSSHCPHSRRTPMNSLERGGTTARGQSRIDERRWSFDRSFRCFLRDYVPCLVPLGIQGRISQ